MPRRGDCFVFAALRVCVLATCSGLQNITLDSTPIMITDGPLSYSANADCKWLITSASGTIMLAFSSFNTESGYDFVKLYGANGLLGRFGGTTMPPTIVTTGPFMRIEFSADSSVEADGFVATATLLGGALAPAQPLVTFSGAPIT
jgi:hypothetical protein